MYTNQSEDSVPWDYGEGFTTGYLLIWLFTRFENTTQFSLWRTCPSFYRYPIALNQTVLIDRQRYDLVYKNFSMDDPYWVQLTYAPQEDRIAHVNVSYYIIVKLEHIHSEIDFSFINNLIHRQFVFCVRTQWMTRLHVQWYLVHKSATTWYQMS